MYIFFLLKSAGFTIQHRCVSIKLSDIYLTYTADPPMNMVYMLIMVEMQNLTMINVWTCMNVYMVTEKQR